MKQVHGYNTVTKATERKLPMHKDPVFIAKEKASFISDHNLKFEKKELKLKQQTL